MIIIIRNVSDSVRIIVTNKNFPLVNSYELPLTFQVTGCTSFKLSLTFFFIIYIFLKSATIGNAVRSAASVEKRYTTLSTPYAVNTKIDAA